LLLTQGLSQTVSNRGLNLSQATSLNMIDMVGIGPFVIEPAVSRKIGHTAMGELTLAGNEWKSATWAFEKGLFAKLVQPEDLDSELEKFASQLATYNPDALAEIAYKWGIIYNAFCVVDITGGIPAGSDPIYFGKTATIPTVIEEMYIKSASGIYSGSFRELLKDYYLW
jgi:hypothetical protein